MNFTNAFRNALDNHYNVSLTENGAIGYKTSGSALLDLNFGVASFRHKTDSEIVSSFSKAVVENEELALRWLFFARDVRGGLGERRLFRVVLKELAFNDPETVIKLIPLIPEYGRFDDLWELLDVPATRSAVIDYIAVTLNSDIEKAKNGKSFSLLAKWLPSCNASSANTIRYAKMICKELGMREKIYRTLLSALRSQLNVVECKMSAKEWDKIDYEAVSSRANLIYGNAFLRNDGERRRKYLESLNRGEAKINAGTLFPHDIVHKYFGNSAKNDTVENLWKALPDTVKGCGNTIVVADGSGSMNSKVDMHSSISALEVANALAIYFAERSSGQFKNKYITFSERPQLVDLSAGYSLRDKLAIARRHNEVANTNIEKVFELILETAVRSNMDQSELPENILIISDMEFDACATCSHDNSDSWWSSSFNRPTKALFDTIKEKFARAGYKVPRLVFWNVNSRTGTVPVKNNELGVALVSGFPLTSVR